MPSHGNSLLYLALLSLYENTLFNSYLTLYDEDLKKNTQICLGSLHGMFVKLRILRGRETTQFIFCDYGNILSLSFVMNIISRVLFYLVLFLMQ